MFIRIVPYELSCQSIYLITTEHPAAARATVAQAIRMAQILGLFREGAAPDVDFIEAETARRVVWLLCEFCISLNKAHIRPPSDSSDCTTAALTELPPIIRYEDMSIAYPSPLADHCITASGIYPQTNLSPSLLTGFHYNARLFYLLGKVIYSRGIAPLTGAPTSPATFISELQSLIAEMPTVFTLDDTPWDEMLDSQSAAGFGTCRANLLITIALVQIVIKQYADSLGAHVERVLDVKGVLKGLQKWVRLHD